MRRLLAVIVLGCLILAGCGDGSGGPSTAAGELSKDEYIAQGDALCQRFIDESDELGEPSTQDELVAFLDAAIGFAEAIHADFAALSPPTEGKSVGNELLSALSDSTDKVREARDLAVSGDMTAVGAAMDEAVVLGRRSDEPAKAYGFQICGSEEELRAG